MANITICPVRHHSPACASAVEQTLLAVRPRLVLVEGPSDACHLIPLLLQPDTLPPVAILAYYPAADGTSPRTVVNPFCDYSPELVALRVASRLSAEARFFDAPAGLWLDEGEANGDAGGESLPDEASPDLLHMLAERCGFASHEEFWDSRFEMAAPADLLGLVGAYGDMVRACYVEKNATREKDRIRESWMLSEVARALGEGLRPEAIAIVCGAAHVTGLREGLVDNSQVERLCGLRPARFALIPYSYPRLSEQLGYGAGNRAPAFYQSVWRHHGDWRAASLEFLAGLLKAMHGRGYALSLADAIEAQRLATNLAGLREKPAVGLEEVRDAATACYSRGSYDPAPFLTSLFIGETVGAVSAMAARTALQQEFLDQVKRYGIPFADSPRELRLNLTSPAERAASAFLHRLGIAGIPFARLLRMGSEADTSGDDPLKRLLALREKWEVRWTPSTDIRLVELAPQGNTLVEVCRRLLRRRLDEARDLLGAADVLRDVMVGRVDALYAEALAACERASSEDDDLVSLGHACYVLDILAGYGERSDQTEVLARLGERVFARAALLLPGAAGVGDEEANRIAGALRALHQVAGRRNRRGESVELLVERLRATSEAAEAHGLLSGLACAILYLDGHLAEENLAAALGLRLSRGEEPLRAAQFVEGLFSLNRTVLVRNRAVVGSLGAFLVGLDGDQFLAVLPLLRRSLAGLSRPEMAYLVETIAAVLGIGPTTAQQAAVDGKQLDELGALDQALGDLFG